MMDKYETAAWKIRDRLRAIRYPVEVDKAWAEIMDILRESFPERKTVPMAMLREVNRACSFDALNASPELLVSISARYGYTVEED
jgi:hypothetical protein